MAEQFVENAPVEEALRLVIAFYCILETEKRNEVMTLAQRYAGHAAAVDSISDQPHEDGDR